MPGEDRCAPVDLPQLRCHHPIADIHVYHVHIRTSCAYIYAHSVHIRISCTYTYIVRVSTNTRGSVRPRALCPAATPSPVTRQQVTSHHHPSRRDNRLRAHHLFRVSGFEPRVYIHIHICYHTYTYMYIRISCTYTYIITVYMGKVHAPGWFEGLGG